MQNYSSEALLRSIFIYFYVSNIWVSSVTLGNYFIAKYAWNLLDTEEHCYH